MTKPMPALVIGYWYEKACTMCSGSLRRVASSVAQSSASPAQAEPSTPTAMDPAGVDCWFMDGSSTLADAGVMGATVIPAGGPGTGH